MIAVLIERRIANNFIRELLPIGSLSPCAVAVRVAALNHKPAYYAVKDETVIKTLLGQLPEILSRLGRIFIEQLDLDLACGSLNRYRLIFLIRRRGGALICVGGICIGG